MKVEQIYSLINDITNEYLGKSDVLNKDLSNIVDVGSEIFNSSDVDNYVKSLSDRIGKTIFNNNEYNIQNIPIYRDFIEYGSILQKININLPDAESNDTWQLIDGQTYDTNIFTSPVISQKFFNNKVTFEIPMSFTERQIKESFNSANELNSFITSIETAINNSLTIKIESLARSTLNNFIANVYNSKKSNSINLLTEYNKLNNTNLTAQKALLDTDFLQYANMKINLTIDRVKNISTLFNSGNTIKFTKNSDLECVFLSDYLHYNNAYLKTNTLHNEFLNTPIKIFSIPYWQGSGKNYDFADTSKIDVKIKIDSSSNKDISISNVLGVIYDKNAIGITNFNKRVTTHYNPKAEFYNNWYKVDCGLYNDFNENFILFYME